MKVLKQEEVIPETMQEMLKGIFIYPTDTVYGIGCDASRGDLVQRIREIKRRDKKPFSVIAPSVNWIKSNCIEEGLVEKFLPGAYTLILKKKDNNFLKECSGNEMLGVRIPDCGFTDKLRAFGVPIVTTSVNFSGEAPANKISDISDEILSEVDFGVDAGELRGKPSKIVLNGKVLER